MTPLLKYLTPYLFMLISPFLYLFIDFSCSFSPIFCKYQHIFMGGQTPLTPHLFSDGGSEIFFMGGQEVEMGGQIVFLTPLTPHLNPLGEDPD